MTVSALLKKVMSVYPSVFEDLPKKKLSLVKEAVLYAGKVSIMEDKLSSERHKSLISSITGKGQLKPSDRLKAYRLRANFSQVELAKKSGISQSNIAAMESGRRPIGITSAQKLAQALKCDYHKLI